MLLSDSTTCNISRLLWILARLSRGSEFALELKEGKLDKHVVRIGCFFLSQKLIQFQQMFMRLGSEWDLHGLLAVIKTNSNFQLLLILHRHHWPVPVMCGRIDLGVFWGVFLFCFFDSSLFLESFPPVFISLQLVRSV